MDTPQPPLARAAERFAELMDSAQRHEQAGEVERAMALYREALNLNPDQHEALHRLGLCAMRGGDHTVAEVALRQAVQALPTEAILHYDLGRLLMAAGRHREARDQFHDALRLSPDHARCHFALGQLYERLSQPREAEGCYRASLEHDPEAVDAQERLGLVLEQQGRDDDAAVAFQTAVDRNPDLPHAWVQLGRNLARRDRPRRALAAYLEALDRQPAMDEALAGIARLLRDRKLKSYPPGLGVAMSAALASRRVRNQDLARPAAHYLRLEYQVDEAVLAGTPSLQSVRRALLDDPLWLGFLENCVNVDPQMERFICLTRKALLLESWNFDTLDDEARRMVIALGVLLNRNQYLYPVDEDERQVLNQLAVLIEQNHALGTTGRTALETQLLLYCMYSTPEALVLYRRLRDTPREAWSDDARELLDVLFHDDDDSAPVLGVGIPRLSPPGSLDDSDEDQCPHQDLGSISAEITPRPLQAILRERFPQCEDITEPGEQLRVLVAGCVNGEEVLRVAREYRGAEVVATDRNRRRLQNLQRVGRSLGLNNLRLFQSDLLHVERLRQQFDVIECTETLSHIPEPVTALRSLLRVLEPGGLLRIGLRSRRARRRIMDARRHVLQAGIGPESHSLVRLRHEVITGREPELVELLLHSDFYTLGGCRDLLFREVEHRFTPLQIEEKLLPLGLEFIGFEFADQRVPQVYREHAPLDPGLVDLESWDHFEEEFPTTFMDGMVFWARDTRPQESDTNVPDA